jgi:hypothetical protein
MAQNDPLLYQLTSKKNKVALRERIGAIHFYLTPSLAQVIELMDTFSLNMFSLNI